MNILRAIKSALRRLPPILSVRCADCGGAVGERGPKDGWQLGDGRTVCQSCCSKHIRQLAERAIKQSHE
jgi:formylmethanofuran dehydrogenase subunit E